MGSFSVPLCQKTRFMVGWEDRIPHLWEEPDLHSYLTQQWAGHTSCPLCDHRHREIMPTVGFPRRHPEDTGCAHVCMQDREGKLGWEHISALHSHLIPSNLWPFAEIFKLLSTKADACSHRLLWESPHLNRIPLATWWLQHWALGRGQEGTSIWVQKREVFIALNPLTLEWFWHSILGCQWAKAH